MSKRKSADTDSNVAKRKTKTVQIPEPCIGPDFFTLQNEMLDWLNALHCAVLAMNQSAAVDGDEIGARARNATRLCHDNLHRLVYELESAAKAVQL